MCIQDIYNVLIPALCLMVLIMLFGEELQQGSLAGRGRAVGRESRVPCVLTCNG